MEDLRLQIFEVGADPPVPHGTFDATRGVSQAATDMADAMRLLAAPVVIQGLGDTSLTAQQVLHQQVLTNDRLVQMPLSTAQIRDLLMPGLQQIVGMYGGLGAQTFAPYLRVDTESAARSRERARGLLKSLLTPEQWMEFEGSGKVTERLKGCDFTLSPGGQIVVVQPAGGGRFHKERWCVYPAHHEEYRPPEDQMIGQLLHLRAGPEQLREKANIFR